MRLRPERANHVWAYGFVEDRALRMLNVVDEFTRECPCIRVGRKLGLAEVINVLADLFMARGTPSYIRFDNGPGSPWENGYVESLEGKLRDELLNAEVFNTLAEARVLIEQWRKHYNTVPPHSSLGYRPPAPKVMMTALSMLTSTSGLTGSVPARPAMH